MKIAFFPKEKNEIRAACTKFTILLKNCKNCKIEYSQD